MRDAALECYRNHFDIKRSAEELLEVFSKEI